MDRKVIFRCDAGHAPDIGTGHITRSKTLATNLVEKGLLRKNDISFYTRQDPDYDLGKSYLAESKFTYKAFPDNALKPNTSSELKILQNSGAALIFMDRLSTSSKLIKGITSAGKKVVTFDDYGSGRACADLAISAIFDDVCKSDNLVRGYRYLVLSKSSYSPLPVSQYINKIVATFGGYDSRSLCQFFLENSEIVPTTCSVDIILGSCDENILRSYYKYIESNRLQGRFKIHIFPDNYHEIIANADLAITSGGLSIFEFSAYGVPSIGLPQYEHQLRTIENLRDAGISLVGSDGMNLSQHKLKDCLEYMNDFTLRNRMAMCAREKIDGLGTDRIISLLINNFPDNFHG
ncbi:MAG: glycosyltransferase [Woeseiaceae bacterium]|nr:glycosyltransferase [Woeseiaceae bacterium]